MLNWLRHLPLLLDGATPDQAKTIQRVLGTQIQSLKVRGPLARDPADALFAAIALLGAEHCEQADKTDVPRRVAKLNTLLAEPARPRRPAQDRAIRACSCNLLVESGQHPPHRRRQ